MGCVTDSVEMLSLVTKWDKAYRLRSHPTLPAARKFELLKNATRPEDVPLVSVD